MSIEHRHTADSITDDALDALYAELAGRDAEARERWIQKQEEQLGIKWADFRAGNWEMSLQAGRDFAAAYVAAARALMGDAPNYSETKLMFDVKIAESPETYTLVVQRHAPGALTPHEAREIAERRAERAEAALARLTTWCDELDATAQKLVRDPSVEHPVAANVRHQLAQPEENSTK
ncbi:hypothetical protein ACFUCH_03735 [Streptomyces olivaceus]|uniref:hypothetical protein n=1 Tax=Streptomyces olivaceus TaxID=47716 RepID=UPI003624F369